MVLNNEGEHEDSIDKRVSVKADRIQMKSKEKVNLTVVKEQLSESEDAGES